MCTGLGASVKCSCDCPAPRRGEGDDNLRELEGDLPGDLLPLGEEGWSEVENCLLSVLWSGGVDKGMRVIAPLLRGGRLLSGVLVCPKECIPAITERDRG